jgi:hypothetical protein
MTPGNNGASTPEEDDPFGYLYADGQANGATPPSGGGGYGYPGSVNRVRAVGERKYGQQTAQGTYGQQAPTAPYGQVPQQGGYGQPNPHYGAPETVPGGAQTARTPMPGHGGGGGRGRGPNTKGLLIGAIAVVAAVVIGIAIAMTGGGDDDKKDSQADTTPTASQSAAPTQEETKGADEPKALPKADAKVLNLGDGVTTASDIQGAKADGGVYVTGFNHAERQLRSPRQGRQRHPHGQRHGPGPPPQPEELRPGGGGRRREGLDQHLGEHHAQQGHEHDPDLLRGRQPVRRELRPALAGIGMEVVHGR